jgi:hypothetical protein
MSDQPEAQLYSVSPPRQAHRVGCVFGPGFFRVVVTGSQPRYCQSQAEVRYAMAMIGRGVEHIVRDGYCLDPQDYPEDGRGDANTPDVVDAEQWLALPQREGMAALGITSEADYRRAYRMVEEAVVARSNREKQVGVHVPIVIKKRGRPLIDVLVDE